MGATLYKLFTSTISVCNLHPKTHNSGRQQLNQCHWEHGSVLSKCPSMTASQNKQYQDPDAEKGKRDSASIILSATLFLLRHVTQFIGDRLAFDMLVRHLNHLTPASFSLLLLDIQSVQPLPEDTLRDCEGNVFRLLVSVIVSPLSPLKARDLNWHFVNQSVPPPSGSAPSWPRWSTSLIHPSHSRLLNEIIKRLHLGNKSLMHHFVPEEICGGAEQSYAVPGNHSIKSIPPK